ncbi:H-type lectin domain containing protein [Ceratobasidium theobromae]|uniref:H-type lectin domain containing protein n=1 Tax=Ceratobasidium theobromae TaxID=1582974 RepID=A0A5N5QB57_9AGAM|nr:H-type lectin domain containing protein [Ceratobasidium theobromae]
MNIQHPQDGIPIGLNKLDIGTGANVRVRAYFENISKLFANVRDAADIHLESWADTRLYDARCSWFDPFVANHGHPGTFQWGTFSSSQLFAEQLPKISFPHSFNNPPNVIVWIRSLDVDKVNNPRVEALATDVTDHDFTLHLRTWGGTHVYDVTVDWIAVSRDNPSVRVGQFTATPDVFPSGLGEGKTGYTGRLDFGQAFGQPPRVVVGFNKIDAAKEKNLRIEANADKITNTGFEMVINSWGDSVIYGGGAAYIAFI